MAVTNRDKQRAWRARQAANAARLAELEGRVDAFACNAAALLYGLSEEAGNASAVRRRAKQLQLQVDALALGDELPALSGVDQRRAELMREHATAAAPIDDGELRRQLRGL